MTDSARTEEIRARVEEDCHGSSTDEGDCQRCKLALAAARERGDATVRMMDEVAAIVSSHREDWRWRDVLADVTALREEVERLKGALTSANPFSGGRDGDVCLWCNRDQPREWHEFTELFVPDNHDADCQLIAALSPSPAQQETVPKQD